MSVQNDLKELLFQWGEGLLQTQVRNSQSKRLNGTFLCPACTVVHGRSFDAMYAFLLIAEEKNDSRYRQAAIDLFTWADHTLSLPNGAFLNDVDSSWLGTTVFAAINLADCLLDFSNLLGEEAARMMTVRLRAAAEFIYGFESLMHNNINYPLSNALALHLCSIVFADERYARRAAELAELLPSVLTENHLLFGEGVPRTKISNRGCRSVDIGYNVEETLPNVLRYAQLIDDEDLIDLTMRSILAHLWFFLEDGGWDNSFGTRNFKWTYWGSRTSDGSLPILLALAERDSRYGSLVQRHVSLLQKATVNNLLLGGPHYHQAGQEACVHHTFEHISMVAKILKHSRLEQIDWDSGTLEVLPRKRNVGLKEFKELATWVTVKPTYNATITAYDWPYMVGGHVSGGTLSLLYGFQTGVILAASMGEYTLRERKNQQVPYGVIHECLALRIEETRDETTYSSIYDTSVGVLWNDQGDVCTVMGTLRNSNGEELGNGSFYTFEYRFLEDRVTIVFASESGKLVIPIISRSDETIETTAEKVLITKDKATVTLESKPGFELPYGEERIFNLCPGFQALRIDVPSKNKKQRIHLSWKYNK